MKKILKSLTVIAAMSVIVVGATRAYFSDTETSAGNTFTAGSIDLRVDNKCYLNGVTVSGCTWTEKDLTGSDLFFNFSALKPGDWGEDTISLHVHNNDAWACMEFKDFKDYDNGCTDPEDDVDTTCNNPGLGEGELEDNLQFAFWADVCNTGGAVPGDNIYQPVCDKNLVQGNAVGWLTAGRQALADKNVNIFESGAGNPLTGSNTYYVAIAWCFGTINIDGGGVITCDGSLVNNTPQTDSLTGTLEFYAEQFKNNASFDCTP